MSLVESMLSALENPIVSECHGHNTCTEHAGIYNYQTGKNEFFAVVNQQGKVDWWHKGGVAVARALTSAEAAHIANLGWKVMKLPAEWTDQHGVRRVSKDTYLLIREDTGKELANVGTRYQPIQNDRGFEVLDHVLAEHGAKYDTAGALFGGKKVWMQAVLPDHAFTINGVDHNAAYVTFMNCHDGSGCSFFLAHTTRIVCQNTLALALGGAMGSKTWRLRHTGDIDQRIADAKDALAQADRAFELYKQNAELLARTPLLNERQYLNGVLDAVLDVTEAQTLKGYSPLEAVLKEEDGKRRIEFEKRVAERKNILDDMLERYESSRCGIGGIRGTAWAGLQAVTEYADHRDVRQRGNADDRTSRRIEDSMYGDGDRMKEVAYQSALAMVAKS